MTALPMMPMYWERFFADTRFLTAEQRGIYALLLGHMWQHDGWIAADDTIIARVLGMHTNTWVRRYKAVITPLLTHGDTPGVSGGVFTQKRLGSELEKAKGLIKKRKAQTAPATAERLRKSGKGGHVTLAVDNTRDVARNVDRNVQQRARAEPEPHEPPSKREGGSGSPLPPPAVGQPAVPQAADRPPAASELAGPFVPAAKPPARPITPAGRSSFLERWERHQAGDEHALDPTPGAPRLSEPVGDPGLWDTVNSKFKPERPALAAKEGPADERQPSDDDLDDLIKF